MKFPFLLSFSLALLLAGTPSCRREPFSPEKAAFAQGKDLIMLDVERFRDETRNWYESGQFDALEKRASELRAGKDRFGNGSWKLEHLYDSLTCGANEPESVWQNHDTLHRDWIAKFPESVTAKVAYADFFLSYAWRARGTGYSNEVTEEAWKLFKERLASARTHCDSARSMSEKCPHAWLVTMGVAIGQSWEKEEFHKLFEEAKAIEPHYYYHDEALSRYLMVRWYGDEGEWEAAAEKEINRSGAESYARVIAYQRGYYDDIFSETKASWRKTRNGFEEMRKSYPNSAEVLNTYCRLACIAEDKELAKALFAEIGDEVITYCWGERRRFTQLRRWANH